MSEEDPVPTPACASMMIGAIVSMVLMAVFLFWLSTSFYGAFTP